MYDCSICDLSFQSSGGLWIHKNIKHKEAEKFTCKDCGKQFSQKSQLKVHINNIHLGTKHKCDQCDKEFSALFSKTRHVQAVHNQMKYSCNICNYKATQKGNLTVHKKSAHEEFQ